MIKAILAMDDNEGIAKLGKIPWHVKADFAHFKKTTIGNGHNIIVMGRKTKESLPKDELPDRVNIILTSNPTKVNEVSNWNNVLQLADMCEDLFIIGGETVYQYAIEESIPEEILISRIPGNYDCDQFIDWGMVLENYKKVDTTEFEEFNLETWHKK